MEPHHTMRFEVSADGWWEVECACGWVLAGMPDADIAADEYGDHRADVALNWARGNG